jgi:hypothetical protein
MIDIKIEREKGKRLGEEEDSGGSKKKRGKKNGEEKKGKKKKIGNRLSIFRNYD